MVAKIKKPVGHNYNPFKHKPRGVAPETFKKVYWPYLPLLLILFLAVGMALAKPSGRVLSYAVDMSRSALLNDSNNFRTTDNLADLRLNSKLDKAAQAKANDMAKRNYWSHNTPSGKAPWSFIVAQHYSYQKLGENLAAGFGDAGSVVSAWYASPSHRQNLMDPNYTDVGFGFANAPDYTSAGGGAMTVVVAMYGQPVGQASQPVPQSSDNLPATSESGTNGKALADRTSKAELLFARSPIAPIATSVAAVALVAALGLWAGRHFIALRRVWQRGEKFVIKHPALDILLIAVAILSFVLSQTAGFIQ